MKIFLKVLIVFLFTIGEWAFLEYSFGMVAMHSINLLQFFGLSFIVGSSSAYFVSGSNND